MELKWSGGVKIGGRNLPEGAEKMGVLVLEEWAGNTRRRKKSPRSNVEIKLIGALIYLLAKLF